MKPPATKSLPALGFLTVVTLGDSQLTGGYLLVDASGRPLEFHCTAPVRASRAQEILYGATLEPFLYGEQIGATLVRKPKTKPLFVCTDCPPVLPVRDSISIPVLLVGEENNTSLEQFTIHSDPVAVPSKHPDDRAKIEQALAELSIEFDLAEPFDRIRGAIEEAGRQQAA